MHKIIVVVVAGLQMGPLKSTWGRVVQEVVVVGGKPIALPRVAVAVVGVVAAAVGEFVG